MATRLHVVLALAKTVKSRTYAAITALHHESVKEALYVGRVRTYRPEADDGVRLPDENQAVRCYARDVLDEYRRLVVERWNVEATVVASNANAVADVVVDDVVLVRNAPATYLIYLEKELADAYTFVSKLPVLEPGEEWTDDPARGCYRSVARDTVQRTKTPQGIVLYPHTPEHPAQVDRVDVDVVVGWWTTTKLSGALTADRRRELLMRIVKLRDAVKVARERANQVEVVDLQPAETLVAYILAT